MNHGNPHDPDNPSAQEITRWVVAASRWGRATQSMVGAASDLALTSRSLADALDISSDGQVQPLDQPDDELAGNLRLLGAEVEADTKELRDRFLATEANLPEYRQIIG